MTAVPLSSAHDERVYGGKATKLGMAIRNGLPVPDGFALGTEFVDAIASRDGGALGELERICARLSGHVAVRSSAIGEDSEGGASFAGQHATVLNVAGPDVILAAVLDVWQSARTASSRAYRDRMGADAAPGAGTGMGVVIQRLVAADVAGVLFTCNPVSGQDEIVVEAAWGLGEAVVQGMVIPDSYRIDRAGCILESRAGFKDVKVERLPEGRTFKAAVAAHLVERPCLDPEKLIALRDLVGRCDSVFGAGPHDIEWAFEQETLYLLQLRPVTKSPALRAFPQAMRMTRASPMFDGTAIFDRSVPTHAPKA